MSSPNDANISVTVDITDGSKVSAEVIDALNALAIAIAGEEITAGAHLDDDAEVSGFSFGKTNMGGPANALGAGGTNPFMKSGPLSIHLNKPTLANQSCNIYWEPPPG